MSEDKAKIMIKNGQPHRLVPLDITLPEIMDYYEEKLGRKARFLDISTVTIPKHADLR